MRYVGHVHIIDVMDQVAVYAEVLGTVDGEYKNEKCVHLSTQHDGVGEDDANEWLKDALVFLLEVLP